VAGDVSLPDPLRRELLDCLLATSQKRAAMIGTLAGRNPSMADLLIDLEAVDDLRARFEMELLNELSHHDRPR
jgi:hypothetical protein